MRVSAVSDLSVEVAAKEPSGSSGRSARRKRLATLAALLVLLVAGTLYRSVGWAQYKGPARRIVVDLSRPDALLRTNSLAALPKDLLRLPIAKALLTEDFVFHYERHPDRLGLVGTLRRIAYEHDLSWKDELFAKLLAEPSEIALWRDGKGALRHFVAVVGRSTLAKVAQELAMLVGKDRQITDAGELVVDGGKVRLFAVEVSGSRTLLVASAGERLVVLSDPGLLLSSENQLDTDAAGTIARLLGKDDAGRAMFRERFGLSPVDPQLSAASPPEHSIAVAAGVFSFGYEPLFPAVAATRFDFAGGAWSTQLRLDPARMPARAADGAEAASALPSGAAVATLLPVDWKLGAPVLEKVPGFEKAAGELSGAMTGPAALAWYPAGRLFSPLVVATTASENPDLDGRLDTLFAWGVQKVPTKGKSPKLRTTRSDGAVVWQRRVEVPSAGTAKTGEVAPGMLTVTLARKGRFLLFSPDSALVDRALETLARARPSLAESGGLGAGALAVVSPRFVSELLQKEALAMLPEESEPVFRAAAKDQLVPRLESLKAFPDYRLIVEMAAVNGPAWWPVEWREVAK